jgi:hypothetical protein
MTLQLRIAERPACGPGLDTDPTKTLRGSVGMERPAEPRSYLRVAHAWTLLGHRLDTVGRGHMAGRLPIDLSRAID